MPDQRGEAALARVLEDHSQLVLLYQPIHVTETKRIVSAEALVRQRREDGEIREASIIVHAAEHGDSEDLFLLDSVLMKKAYTAAASWQRSAPDVHLNVNLSPREFQEGNVLDRLSALVTGCAIDTHRINLEITETSYIKHPTETMLVLEELKKLGVQLWLDDFGTGHSSLTHLQKFPLDGLKLPAEFVGPIVDDFRSRKLVLALIGLAHDLGLKVIAEGVEKEAQLAILRDAGCDMIQGFLFSRPMSCSDLQRLVDGQRPADQPIPGFPSSGA